MAKKGKDSIDIDLYNIDNFTAQYKRSTIPLIVLRLLHEKEMYAYEIIQETTKRSGGIYKMPLLYNILNKFKEQGYIEESRKEVTDDNRVRVYYSITDTGKAYFRQLQETYTKLTEAVAGIVFDGAEGRSK